MIIIIPMIIIILISEVEPIQTQNIENNLLAIIMFISWI